MWKLLLGLHLVPTPRTGPHLSLPSPDSPSEPRLQRVHPLLQSSTYYSLISREPSPMFAKIRNDSFRTLATDQQFRSQVGEERLVRCLEAFVWRQLGR